MSDFLNNFSSDNYQKKLSEKQQENKTDNLKEEEEAVKETAEQPVKTSSENKQRRGRKRRRREAPPIEEQQEPETIASDETLLEEAYLADDYTAEEQEPPQIKQVVPTAKSESDQTGQPISIEEDIETDPEYQKKRRKKMIAIGAASVLVLFGLIFAYYQFTHVKLINLVGKELADARTWANDNKVKLKIEQKYDFDKAINTVTKQEVAAGKKIKKGKTMTLTASLGPNPDDVIPLPDFSKLSKKEAEGWIAENKAENLNLLTEYHDKIAKDKFLRQEITNKDVTPENYKRKDSAVIYYSKGAEVLTKDIPMPDFKGKTKADVEAWVKANEIKMTYKESDSDKIEEGSIIAQSVAKDVKIAKRTEMSVTVSTGKGILIPDFSNYNEETATTALEAIPVTVKTSFSDSVPFGRLISQSIPAGTKVSEKKIKPMLVTYSYGQPYLRSYYGELEGDLSKLFFDDYQSKGANINYTTYYMNSDEERGRVVRMSHYNQYVGMNFTVSIGISNGSNSSPGAHSERNKEGNTEE